MVAKFLEHNFEHNSLMGGWNLFSTIISCRAALESFFTVALALLPCPPLSISSQKFPFISNCTEHIIVCSETVLYFNKVNKLLIR